MTLNFHGYPLTSLGINVGVSRFDHIWIKSPLSQIVKVAEALGCFLKYADKFVSDAAAFFFRICNIGNCS